MMLAAVCQQTLANGGGSPFTVCLFVPTKTNASWLILARLARHLETDALGRAGCRGMVWNAPWARSRQARQAHCRSRLWTEHPWKTKGNGRFKSRQQQRSSQVPSRRWPPQEAVIGYAGLSARPVAVAAVADIITGSADGNGHRRRHRERRPPSPMTSSPGEPATADGIIHPERQPLPPAWSPRASVAVAAVMFTENYCRR